MKKSGEIITEKDLFLADFETSAIPHQVVEISEKEEFEILPLEEVEKNYILKVLNALNWNKSLAAKKLGIDRKTLNLKLKKWNLAPGLKSGKKG
jgi:transcriptional regulator with PAS, ATPase and Fis domain